jgi:pimeloyl-ACP methyl ester carboxylesterase
VSDHRVVVPGGKIYYRSQDSGPPLVLIGGGPSNADTLAALAGELAPSHTVITYDRRGYSRSRIDDRSQPATMSLHANDVRAVIDDLGAGSVSAFATSVGALIGLELAGADPRPVARLVVHEPPLGQLVPAPRTGLRSTSSSTKTTPARRSTRSPKASASTASGH